jgi:intracellular sulfur oxidation DsrE/DsrF family protein
MEKQELAPTSRRGFLGSLAAGTTALGIAAIATPFNLHAEPSTQTNAVDADAWFNTIKGKHRIAFDVTKPHQTFPFAWPKVFILTNQATGSSAKDCSVVVILRHDGIPYAFQDSMWAKYKFGEFFKAGELGKGFVAADAATAASTRNPLWNPKPGDFVAPGLGPIAIGINELQADGVMFCICDVAMTVYSHVIGGMMKMDPAEVKKEWVANLIPGVQVVPSGIWAVGRAQEHNCAIVAVG